MNYFGQLLDTVVRTTCSGVLPKAIQHLRHEARKAVIDLLRGWRGGATIVSHDRELLKEMDAIVELTTLGAALDHLALDRQVDLAEASRG